MTAENVVRAAIRALEASGTAYMVVGSLSSNLYGIPRSTHDADFVVAVEGEGISTLMNHFGPEFTLDPQVYFESVTVTTRNIIRHTASLFGIEVFHLSNDAHDQQRFSRRLRTDILGEPSWAPTPEDVVIQKLRWAALAKRSKDLDDARDVLAVQGEGLDWDYVNDWCGRHGTRALLDDLRRSIPPIAPNA